jgi:hypothetical protein
MKPTVAFPPATPFTLQVTAVFELPITVAEYCDIVPNVTLTGPLKTRVTAEPLPVPPGGTGGVVRSTARPSETIEFATLVAVIVTFEAWVALAGAE